jgi:hypothetical protein
VGNGLADEDVGVRHSAAILGCVLRLSQRIEVTNRSDESTRIDTNRIEIESKSVEIESGLDTHNADDAPGRSVGQPIALPSLLWQVAAGRRAIARLSGATAIDLWREAFAGQRR